MVAILLNDPLMPVKTISEYEILRRNRLNKDPFEEYIIGSEPEKKYKVYAWHTAIGLQAVDGLKTSEYLLSIALRNIEGEISFEEANSLLQQYYNEKPSHSSSDRTEEADKVSARIASLISEKAFSFTYQEYLSIHRRLFTGIYSHAGRIRDYNITKKEWVLDGATVIYGSATELLATLDYDFSCEKKFSYKKLSMDEIIHHLAVFVSRLWQTHVFGEGNTRTTAVFLIKYLHTLGFDVTNSTFAENAWYFRNALVRANYNDLKNGIHETTEYLELFLRNLLLNENNPLRNRELHVRCPLNLYEKANIDTEKANIDTKKANIDSEKANIDIENSDVEESLSTKTIEHIKKLKEVFATEKVFGRADVIKVLGLKNTGSSSLLKKMLELKIIEPVSGYGKGKYRFVGK